MATRRTSKVCAKVYLQGMRWVMRDPEVCHHRRILRRAILRGQLLSLIFMHSERELRDAA